MFSSLSRRRVIALVVLTCVLFITLDRNGNPVIDRMRSVVATAMRPFDTAARAIVLPIERAWSGMTSYDELQRENEALRDQIAQMKGNDVEAQSVIIEYRQLLNVLQLSSKFSYPTVAAQVVGESPSNFQNTVEINVGSNNGVQPGMPVTDGAGLIGKITQVFPDRSIVRLITDPDYAVTAQVLSFDESTVPATTTTAASTEFGPTSDTTTTTAATTTTLVGQPTNQPFETTTTQPVAITTTTLTEVVRETGTLEGQGGGKPMLLRFTDSTSSVTSVRVGAIVDTAGGNSSLAPNGIPIGVISRVVPQSGGSSFLVEVTPNANLRRLNFVTVVLFIPNPDAVGR